MGRTIVCGDIHGNYKALIQCLERSFFDYENDTLIQLGDVVDGHPDTKLCVDELLKIRDRIQIRGNHDEFFLKFISFGVFDPSWLPQGGINTMKSYGYSFDDNGVLQSLGFISDEHSKFFKYMNKYYIDDKNRMFTHGGFNRHFTVKNHSEFHDFSWDRSLWKAALSDKRSLEDKIKHPFKIFDNFSEVYIGHTSTENWGKNYPMNSGVIWNVDTGAGGKGKLSFMDVDTKEVWQSDCSIDLYDTFK